MIHESEDRQRLFREKVNEAISLAMESRWEEAVSVNRLMLQLAPNDIEASNRLGKALSELGDWEAAREAFQRSLEMAPHNAIARKNLERLARLGEAPSRKAHGQRLAPHLFIEDSGKTTQVTLQDPPNATVLAGVSAGTPIELRPSDGRLGVYDLHGQRLGLLSPAMGCRLLRMLDGGNQYQAAVARVSGDQVTVVLRETYQHPSLRGVLSFPTKEGSPLVADQPFSYEQEEVERQFALAGDDEDAGVNEESASLSPTNDDSEDGIEDGPYPEEAEE